MALPPILPTDQNPENSIVVQRMREFKQDLVARDADTILFMGKKWQKLEKALEANIQLLVLEMKQLQDLGQPVNPQSIYRMRRYQTLIAQVREEMSQYNLWAADYISVNQEKFGILGINNAVEAIELTYLQGGVASTFFDRLPVSAFELMVGNAGKGGPVYDLLQSVYPTAVERMTNILIQNVALGIGPGQTAIAMIDGLAGVGLNHALTVATTEQMRVYRESSRLQYGQSGAVSGYRRFASKDGNTCILCIALDGEIYPTSEAMSVHPRDRCVNIPIVRGVPGPYWESGSDWFKKQDPALQRQMMGPGAHELWKNGDIKLQDLVVKEEHPIWGPTLKRKALRDLEP